MVSSSDFLIIAAVALAAGVGLTWVGILIEFSLRKTLPQPQVQPQPAPAETIAPPPAPEPARPPQGAPPPPSAAAPAPEPQPSPPPTAAPLPPPPKVERPEPQAGVAVAVKPEVEPRAGEPRVAPAREPAQAPAPGPLLRPAPAARLGLGLRRTRENFLGRLRAALTGSAKLDEIYEGLEEALIGADVGVETSMKVVEAVRARLKNNANSALIRDALKDELTAILLAVERPWTDCGRAPMVVMLVGVNGVGKTTTVAKLAARLKAERGPVLVAAADTFRAAAIEQLQIWCERVGVDVIKQKQGSDPAAVAFDAVKAAVARKVGTVLIDTAGRLQTKVNLMEELKKVARVVAREIPGAPHETWLVLDATTGQNALSQAKLFADAVPLTGVVLAKLDSSAKGGVIVAVAERLKLPVRFVGVGEEIGDLRAFDAGEFAQALFAEEQEAQSASGSYAA